MGSAPGLRIAMNKAWPVVLLLLTGCTTLGEDVTPLDVVCEAECTKCEECTVRCIGTGQGKTSETLEVHPAIKR